MTSGAGKLSNTPLMAALQKWNVRIIDYLLERKVDPSVKDKFGFTARRKAEIRNLRTIGSMLTAYEETFSKIKVKKVSPPITNEYWVRQLKVLNATLGKKNKNFVHLDSKDFTR